MTDRPDWLVFLDNLEAPPMSLSERQAAIAEQLRKGRPSEAFCSMLAGMLDGMNTTQWSLTLQRRTRGQPKRKNVELGRAMIAATEGVARGSMKAAKQDVAKRFGVTVRTAETAMQQELLFRELSEFIDKV